MKAVILGPGNGQGRRAELVEMGAPLIGPGEVLVKMKASGICGTDIEKIKGEYTAAMPVIGHEAVGIVASVGEGVSTFTTGDRVFPHHHVSCGKCYYCAHDSPTMCDQYRKTNLDPGGFAEFFRVPRANIVRGGVVMLPQDLTFDIASMVEPVACCIRAHDRCGIEEGEKVLIAGAGPVGMMHALLLREKKAEAIVSDVNMNRLAFAEKANLATVLDASRTDVPHEVRDRTAGRGADLAIVASGSPKAVVQALRSLRKGGRLCLFGIPERGSLFEQDTGEVYNSEISIISSYGATEDEVPRALGLLASNSRDFGQLVTHRFPLSEFQRGIEASMDGSGMKVLITN